VSGFFDAIFGAPSSAAAAAAPAPAPGARRKAPVPALVIEAAVVALWKLLVALWTPSAARPSSGSQSTASSSSAATAPVYAPALVEDTAVVESGANSSGAVSGGVTERDELFARVRWLTHVDWRHRHIAQQTMEGLKAFIESKSHLRLCMCVSVLVLTRFVWCVCSRWP
jgi:hypothetical protein